MHETIHTGINRIFPIHRMTGPVSVVGYSSLFQLVVEVVHLAMSGRQCAAGFFTSENSDKDGCE